MPYGGDFSLLSNGDLLLATNNNGVPTATEQYLVRLLLTNPILYNPSGQPLNSPDDLFNPAWGGGLPGEVGSPITQALLDTITSNIRSALQTSAEVDQTQPINVTVSQVGPTQINAQISCTAASGGTINISVP